ncbi:hypothetical protein, partial [Nonomuraea sp. NPDC003754]
MPPTVPPLTDLGEQPVRRGSVIEDLAALPPGSVQVGSFGCADLADEFFRAVVFEKVKALSPGGQVEAVDKP